MATGKSILSPSLIKLYGRTITEIQLNIPATGAGSGAAGIASLGANQFLRAQLSVANAGLARIYGFSFEGHYYDLPQARDHAGPRPRGRRGRPANDR